MLCRRLYFDRPNQADGSTLEALALQQFDGRRLFCRKGNTEDPLFFLFFKLSGTEISSLLFHRHVLITVLVTGALPKRSITKGAISEASCTQTTQTMINQRQCQLVA